VWEVAYADGPRATRLGHRDFDGDHRGCGGGRRRGDQSDQLVCYRDRDAVGSDQGPSGVRQRDSGQPRAFYAKEKGIFLQNGLDVDLSLDRRWGKSMAASRQFGEIAQLAY